MQQGGTHTCRWQPGKCPQVRSALRPAGVWEVSPGSGSPCRPGVGGSQHQRTFQRGRASERSFSAHTETEGQAWQ